MAHPWLILFILGLAAALMPWQLGFELYLLGTEGGLKKAAAFLGGITFFRALLLFVVGLGWMAVSLKQWIFMLAAANQIILITGGIGLRVLLSLLFLLLASLVLLLPFPITLLRPDDKDDLMQRFSDFLSGSSGYLISLLLGAGGIFLIWIGARGLLNFLA